MQEIHAWRLPPSAVAAGPAAAADAASQSFFRARHLGAGEPLEDGFRDAGGTRDPCGRPGRGGSAADVVLLVDRASDRRLEDFAAGASRLAGRCGDATTRAMVAALLVSEALGRCIPSDAAAVAALDQRSEAFALERLAAGDAAAGVVPLGDFLAEKHGSSKRHGAGGAWHRALLLKALCDWLSLAPCALRRGPSGSAAWNCVALADGQYVVDVLFDPGAMYEEGSPRAAAYLARLTAGVAGDAAREGRPRGGRANTMSAPSVEEGVKGKMARPPWHVEPWELDFQRSDRAGRGGFGEVFRGRWAGQAVAVKEVRDGSPNDMEICQFILEISLLAGLSHPNIVRFWRGCVDLRSGSRTLLLVTEWMDQGTLSELWHESQEMQLTFARCLVLGMAVARGVEYLHEVGVLHLDLKSPNVLLDRHFHAKLCDFGLAKVREQVGAHTTLRGVSPAWAPPEMFDETAGALSERADVYSFGIIVFELFTRQLPFAELNQMQLTRAKSKGTLPTFPPGLDSDVVDVLRLCLQHRPSARPAMRGCIAQLRQLARQRGLDLPKEKLQMERQGLDRSGALRLDGSDAGGRRPLGKAAGDLAAEERQLEAEVAKLRKQVQDEEGKLRMLEEQIRQSTFHAGADGDGHQRLAAYCAANTEQLGELKFRCRLCMKLFRGDGFVHKHIQERHFSEMLASLGGSAGAGFASDSADPGAGAAEGAGAGADGEKFFDTDVAEESHARMYTDKLSPMDGGGSANVALSSALQDAARSGDLDRVQQCVQQGAAATALAQPDADGCTPLHLAALGGNCAVVKYLLSQAADLGAKNDSGAIALHLAAQEGKAEVCEALLHAASSPNAQDTTKIRRPLHLAASNGHQAACRVLLVRRADVNACDADGLDALHSATRFGSADLCELLLSWGAAVNATDDDGWCVLHEAARWGDADLIDALARRKADMMAVSHDGEGPLHVVPGGYAELDVVEALIGWRANINVADFDGETPLHVAVKLGDENLVGIFLDCGADANARTKAGTTPLDLAKKDEIKWLLRSHKARRGIG